MTSEKVTGKDLPDINEHNLQTWGMTVFGPRKHLLNKINKLCEENHANAN